MRRPCFRSLYSVTPVGPWCSDRWFWVCCRVTRSGHAVSQFVNYKRNLNAAAQGNTSTHKVPVQLVTTTPGTSTSTRHKHKHKHKHKAQAQAQAQGTGTRHRHRHNLTEATSGLTNNQRFQRCTVTKRGGGGQGQLVSGRIIAVWFHCGAVLCHLHITQSSELSNKPRASAGQTRKQKRKVADKSQIIRMHKTQTIAYAICKQTTNIWQTQIANKNRSNPYENHSAAEKRLATLPINHKNPTETLRKSAAPTNNAQKTPSLYLCCKVLVLGPFHGVVPVLVLQQTLHTHAHVDSTSAAPVNCCHARHGWQFAAGCCCTAGPRTACNDTHANTSATQRSQASRQRMQTKDRSCKNPTGLLVNVNNPHTDMVNTTTKSCVA